MVNRLFSILCVFALAAGGCGGSGVSESDLPQSDRVSPCEGFAANGDTLFIPKAPPPADYCAAEVLHWQFDEASGRLALVDARVLLNCCGEHSMKIELINGTYRVTERDAPEQLPDGTEARCGCMCVFDFGLEAQSIPAGVIHLGIEREVTDWPEASISVWEGDLDLSLGSGFVILDDVPEENWCGNG